MGCTEILLVTALKLGFSQNCELKYWSLQTFTKIKSYILYGINAAPLILFWTKHAL